MAEKSRQDGPGARTKLFQGAAGSWGPGPGTWLRDEPIGRTSGPRAGGLLVGGLDFRVRSRQEAHGPGNDSSNGWKRQRRQALGGSEGLSLSFMR